MFLLVFSGMSKDNQDFLTKHVTISLVVSGKITQQKSTENLADWKRLRTTNSLGSQGRQVRDGSIWRGPPCKHQPLPWIKSTRSRLPGVVGPLVIQGFSKFLGLFQVIMANPVFGTLTWDSSKMLFMVGWRKVRFESNIGCQLSIWGWIPSSFFYYNLWIFSKGIWNYMGLNVQFHSCWYLNVSRLGVIFVSLFYFPSCELTKGVETGNNRGFNGLIFSLIMNREKVVQNSSCWTRCLGLQSPREVEIMKNKFVFASWIWTSIVYCTLIYVNMWMIEHNTKFTTEHLLFLCKFM